MELSMIWNIGEECFLSRTDLGTYKIGDWGGGKLSINFPDGTFFTRSVSVEEAKELCEIHYLKEVRK